jgi:putative glutamine amidotransferase
MKPLIGLTTERVTAPYGPQPNRDLQGVLRTYIEALGEAGAIPVIVPLGLSAADLLSLYTRLDGVLLPGGGDIDPVEFGEAPHPKLGDDVDPLRDATELALARQAIGDDRPLLAVCRGVQVLNVALGGTLYQDLPSQYPGALKHSYRLREATRDYLAHAVQIEEDSHLARVLGTSIVQVNSRHHQAIRDLAPGLQIVARSQDGVIEGVEHPARRFVLGVQWHPENLQALPEMKRLFEAFVQAASDP